MSLSDKFDKSSNEKSEDEGYGAAGTVRNLCFVLEGGRRLFLNYAYLISGDYTPDESAIVLSYTTHTVTLKGHNLDALYDALMLQLPKTIAALGKRYEATEESTATVITEIVIQKE